MNDIINMRPAIRATLDALTDRIILPVDARRAGTVSLSGTWGDIEEYGPGCVVIELKTVAGTLWASHRITADTSFTLSPRTERVEAQVTSRAPGMSLELTIAQSAELAAPRTRSLSVATRRLPAVGTRRPKRRPASGEWKRTEQHQPVAPRRTSMETAAEPDSAADAPLGAQEEPAALAPSEPKKPRKRGRRADPRACGPTPRTRCGGQPRCARPGAGCNGPDRQTGRPAGVCSSRRAQAFGHQAPSARAPRRHHGQR